MNAALITPTTSRVNDDQAVNIADLFWLLRDSATGRIDVHEVDPENTADDITLGALDTANATVEQAIERVAASVTLDDAMRAEIRNLLA